MRDRPPWTLWLAPALVAVLRALPWMATLGGAPTTAGVLPPIGYNPKDWLQYVAFIREAAAGSWIASNPLRNGAGVVDAPGSGAGGPKDDSPL